MTMLPETMNDAVHMALHQVATDGVERTTCPDRQTFQRLFVNLVHALCRASRTTATPLQSGMDHIQRQAEVLLATYPRWNTTGIDWSDDDTLLQSLVELYVGLAVMEQELSYLLGFPINLRELAYQQMIAEGGD